MNGLQRILALSLSLSAGVACGASDDENGGGPDAGGTGGAGGGSPDAAPPTNPESLLERYKTTCPPRGLSFSGTLSGTALEPTYSAGFGGSPRNYSVSRNFGSGGLLLLNYDPSNPLESIEYGKDYPVTGQLVFPEDSPFGLAVACAGAGSTLHRTPLEERYELSNVSLHQCPGTPVSGELDFCLPFGFNDGTCVPAGVTGTVEGTPFSGTSSSNGGTQSLYYVDFPGGYLQISMDARTNGTVTSGVVFLSHAQGPATYCVGTGSTFHVEETNGFTDATRISLRNLSRLPDCSESMGSEAFTACFRL